MIEIDDILRKMGTTEGASDVFLTVGSRPQFRVHRKLVPLDLPVLTHEDTERLCLSILTEKQKEIFLKENEYDGAYAIGDEGRYRINMSRQQGHISLVARIIMEQVKDYKELGLPAVIQSFAQLQAGLILITGPTGSGKSTTLAAMLDFINRTKPSHIVTIEDPIEIIHSSKMSTIDQREVGYDTVSYKEALRRVLRQSPDVIMIGEIRDRESAQAAISLAETGHLTLATLHTRGTISALHRMIEMFPPEQATQMRSQLAASLAGVVWQQLIPGVDGNSLVACCEVMTVTSAVRALILNGNTHEILSLLQTGKNMGMCSMQQAVDKLESEGLIKHQKTIEETMAESVMCL